MITISMIATQLDTIETDTSTALQVPYPCEWCHKQIVIMLVRLGSQQDRDLTQRNANSLLWEFSHALDGLFSNRATGKVIRVRLKPKHLFSLRQRISLYPKASCPYCRKTLDLCLQPA